MAPEAPRPAGGDGTVGCALPPPQRRHGAEAEGRLFVSRLEEPRPLFPSPTPHPSLGVGGPAT